MRKLSMLMAITMLTSWPTLAGIDALNAAAENMCQKTKQCIKEQMVGNDDVPPSMTGMIDTMVDEMCEEFTKLTELEAYSGLIEPATECLDSMAARDCATLMNSDQNTPACQRLETLGEQYEGLTM